MLSAELIRKKRDGAELSGENIEELITGYVKGDIPDYQISAWLMAVFFQGMSARETASLTRSMINSGSTYSLSSDRPLIDKHSTGGVGDKVSLVLAPLAAACGLAVPMVAGRGLGHTGGTLDKLQSISGFRISLSAEEFQRQVEELGVAIVGQSDDFVPADKKLYALRDVTGTVESIPLLCSSILSKKVASGARGLIMDVKTGSGAFMGDLHGARTLAHALCSTGKALGLPVRALLTDMNQPTGQAVGNALEVRESIDCLKGGGPADLTLLTIELVAEMVFLGELARDLDSARDIARKNLNNGAALQIFQQMVEHQGGDLRIVDDPGLLPGGCEQTTFTAETDGFLSITDCRAIGLAALALGAGRRKVSDEIDPAVGLLVLSRIGDAVTCGQPLIQVYSRNGKGRDECMSYLRAAMAIVPEQPLVPDLFLERIS